MSSRFARPASATWQTAPYGHDGSFASLSDFLAGGHGADLTAAQVDTLNVSLLSVQGSYPARPWSD